MDKFDSDLVNLHDTRADQSNGTSVHLRSTQEDAMMLEAEVVDRICELAGQGLGSKRIARPLGISHNTVRYYRAGATVGFHERPATHLHDAATLGDKLMEYN
jgi:FixJ family two-component response regulator